MALVMIGRVQGVEMAVDDRIGAELYESGIIHHRIMESKHVSRGYTFLGFNLTKDSRRLGKSTG